MNIYYKQFYPASARTGFAQITQHDRLQLLNCLTDFLLYLTEKSMNRTQDPWATVSETARSLWGYSQYQRKPNNMLSVLGGIIKKLRAGLDLTDKQLAAAQNIGQLLPLLGDHLNTWPMITFTLCEQWPSTGDAVVDLQNSLFGT